MVHCNCRSSEDLVEYPSFPLGNEAVREAALWKAMAHSKLGMGFAVEEAPIASRLEGSLHLLAGFSSVLALVPALALGCDLDFG